MDPRKLAAEGNISFWGEAMHCGWSASMECSEGRQKRVRQQLSKKPMAGGRQESPCTYTNGHQVLMGMKNAKLSGQTEIFLWKTLQVR
jgi:hypothetical protein